MHRLVLACALIAGCGGGTTTAPPPKVPPPAPPVAVDAAPALTVAETGLAGLDGGARATLVALRAKLASAGYSVKVDNGGGSTVFDVYRGADKLFYVVANDDGTLFNVHVVSTQIPSSTHGWRVGGSLSDLSGINCECWGSTGNEVATCYKEGEHVAVVYDRACTGLDLNEERNRKVLQGATISRLVWQPKPWAKPPATPPAAAD